MIRATISDVTPQTSLTARDRWGRIFASLVFSTVHLDNTCAKLDRLARSLPDARAIADELTARRISLSLGGSVYDPTDAVGRLLFNVLAMVAEFESDLIRLRTVEGMKVAKAKGRLRGKQPKLSRKQEAHLVSLVHSGEYSTLEVAELFSVGRSTVYRAIERQRIAARAGIAEASSRR